MILDSALTKLQIGCNDLVGLPLNNSIKDLTLLASKRRQRGSSCFTPLFALVRITRSLEGRLHAPIYFLVRKRLLDEIGRSISHRIDCHTDIAATRDHNHRKPMMSFFQQT